MTANPPVRILPRWKVWLFRCLAILMGLSPLLLLEFGLRVAGAGKASDANDPFVGFSAVQPLFVLNKETSRYEIARSRLSHFQPDSFSVVKAANEFRIFVIGGSTVQGRPWSIETSFSAWLELNLNAADPSRKCEVVNCGGVSYATYRLAPIVQEVLQYEPDLIIFCEGNNEFLEDREYAPWREQPTSLVWLEQQATRLRTYNFLRASVLACRGNADGPARPVLGLEVDARLDWQGGLAEYCRDPAWQRDVIRHFDFNLQRIVAISQEVGTPLLFVSPVANLQWAPFKSEHRADLSSGELAEYESMLEQARGLLASDLPAAIAKFQAAVALDPAYADGHYELGMALLEAGRRNEAEKKLLQAKELDVCPLRILQPMRIILQRVAADTNTPLVDAHELFSELSRNGFPDNQWLIDHVHPTIEGNQQLADAIADRIVELGELQPSRNWQAQREAAYQQHLASLSQAYFQRGRDRLKSEQGWARGQVRKIKSNQP